MTSIGFRQFDGQWQENAQLARDTIAMKATRAIIEGGLPRLVRLEGFRHYRENGRG